MARRSRLSIALVHHPDDPPPSWPLHDLREALVALGHEVRLGETDDSEVVHLFGVRAMESGVQDGTQAVVLSPSFDSGDTDGGRLRAAVRQAHMVVVRDTAHAARANRLGVPWWRIRAVPPALDSRYRRLGPAARRTERSRLLTTAAVGSAGLRPILELLRTRPDLELIVFEDDAADALPTDVEALARAWSLRDRIAVVHGGDADQRAWWLRSADVALALDPDRDAPHFISEAMGCGTAVVCAPVGENADLVVHGVTGFQVDTRRVASVRGAVGRIVGDEFSRDSFGMAASDRAAQRFSWERIARDIEAAYVLTVQPFLAPEREPALRGTFAAQVEG